MDESVPENAPQQSFKRNRAQPTQASGKKVKQRRDECQKPNPAQQLCNRRNHFQGSEPADSQSQSKHWQQERANPKKLQEQVRAEGTYYANPISRHTRAGQHRGAIQRWVKRRIRSQRKEKKERGDAQDETKQLIQPPVIGRVKNASYKFHRQLHVARTANRRSCADTSPNARARQL